MSKKQTVTQKAEPWKPAQEGLKSAITGAQDLYAQGGFSADPYAGPRVAPQSAATTGAQSSILNIAAGGAPGTEAARSTIMGMLSGGLNPNLEAVKSNALGSAIPAATAMFSGSGLANSSAAQDYVGRAAAEAIAPYEYQAFDTAQNRAIQAAGMLPGLDRAIYDPALMTAAVGREQDAYNQALLDSNIAKYYEGENQQAQNLQGYLNAILGLGGMGGTQSTTSPVPGTGLGPAITGGLGAYGTLAGLSGISGTTAGLGGLLAGLAGLSDRDAKEDIERVGWTDGGTAIYRYKYKGLDGYMLGVMADEVPWAIKGKIGPYDAVDYARVY